MEHLTPNHIDDRTFESNAEVITKSCLICSQILLPSSQPAQPELEDRSGRSYCSNRLEQLLSTAGLDIYVSRRTFRKAVQSRCIICRGVDARGRGEEPPAVWTSSALESAQQFGIGPSDNEEAPLEEDAEEEHDDDDEPVVLNYRALRTGQGSNDLSVSSEQGEVPGSLDIKALRVTGLRKLQYEQDADYDVFTPSGKSGP